MYAALMRAAERWRGLKMTEFERRRLKGIHDDLGRDFAARRPRLLTIIGQSPHAQLVYAANRVT
jgi:hypothetical protein